MNKKTYITILVSAIGFGYALPSFAQWAVIDQTLIATNRAGFNGLGGQIQQLNSATAAMMQQNAMNLQNADIRARGAAAQQDILNKTGGTLRQQPTLAECVAITQAKKQQASIKASTRKGGGSGNVTSPDELANKAPESDTELADKTVAPKSKLGTCTENDAGSGGCKAGEVGPYAAGDFHPRGLDCNIKGISLTDQTDAICNNYTMDKESYDVAMQNARNQSLYAQPKRLTQDQMAKNPNYNAVVTPINAKLFAANEALMFNARMKQQSATAPSGAAKDMWNGGADYTDVTGLKSVPEKPSLYDMVNYSVYNAYSGKTTPNLDITEVNKRLSLTNFILWKQYQQQEQQTRLLANILTQMVTPVNTGAANSINNENRFSKAAGGGK